ncbi:MAG: hypothetical protein KC589_02345 [Nanoarchaeota archaeon]|nr:hypothetical protein [Nanoarchaeota archaeon]MCA9495757.1 hypothetical protein [Nanoarchaeota archaeon]
MTAKKKTVKKPSHTKKVEEGYDNLYVCMYEAQNKRKHLLSGIKTALIMQEELERITGFREEKLKGMESIKNKMQDLNSNYKKLRELLPNVKNVISYTEKELSDLDAHINYLKTDIQADNEKIYLDETLEDSILDGHLKEKMHEFKTQKRRDERNVRRLETDYGSKSKNLSRIDRIQNNLKVIEAKLKSTQ